jgi:hypothetical protein
LPGQNTPLTIHGKVLSLSPDAPSSSAEVGVEIQFADRSPTDLARLKAWTLQAIPPAPDQA